MLWVQTPFFSLCPKNFEWVKCFIRTLPSCVLFHPLPFLHPGGMYAWKADYFKYLLTLQLIIFLFFNFCFVLFYLTQEVSVIFRVIWEKVYNIIESFCINMLIVQSYCVVRMLFLTLFSSVLEEASILHAFIHHPPVTGELGPPLVFMSFFVAPGNGLPTLCSELCLAGIEQLPQFPFSD